MAAKAKTPLTPKERPVVKKTGGISVISFSKAGQKTETDLSKELFGQKPNAKLVAQAVRIFLSRQRSAKAKTKGRAEVIGSVKKIYRQKGTGGARHGSRKAPLFVGGGLSHGPRGIENYKLELPKKLGRLALVSALSDKAQDKKVVVADIENIEPKTKVLNQFLQKAGVDGKATIVYSGDTNLYRAGRNMEKVRMIRADQLNTYDVMTGGMLIVTKEALTVLEKRGAAK